MEYLKLVVLGASIGTTFKLIEHLIEHAIYFRHWDYQQKIKFYVRHHKKIGEEISEKEAREMAYMAVGGKTLIDLWEYNENQEKTLVKLN